MRLEGLDYLIVGDVTGYGKTLEALHKQAPHLKIVCLGDIIDRGPRIRESLHIVYDMVRAGQALCLMGNHEFNALGWCTPAPAGSGKQFVREHTPRHARLIHETLEQFEHYPA